jgi:ATP-dependent Clp protease ATP-binding subunit ClpX
MRFVAPAYEDVPTVAEMVDVMNRTVTGLETTKLRLALHLRRFMVGAALGRERAPQNVLIIGPSGGGKTHLVRRLLESIPVMWTEANATEYSDVGYVGRELTSMYLGLFQPQWRGRRGEETPYTMPEVTALAEQWGVVVLDEFDKLQADPRPKQGERAVGRALQAELLKLSEGTEALVKRNDDDRGVFLNTHHVLHIAMGAFQGLNRMVGLRDNPEVHPGDIPPNAYMKATIFDIIKFGFLEELVGRFSTIVTLPPLDAGHMSRILREHVVPAFVRQCADDGIRLVIEDGAIAAAATRSTGLPIGARALIPMIDDCLHTSWSKAVRGDTILLTAAGVMSDSSFLERATGSTGLVSQTLAPTPQAGL